MLVNNARIIYEDINLAKSRNRLFDNFLAVFSFAYISFNAKRFSTQCLDLLFNFLKSINSSCSQSNTCPTLSKP